MAKMSLQEKLAAARAGGPAKPAEEAPPPAASEPEPAAEAAPEEPAAPAPPPPRPAAPAPTGRKLSLKEKLAAAREGGAAVPAPPAAEAPEPVAAEAQAEPEPAAEPAPAPAAPPPPAPTGRPLTLKEKLAAARGGAAPAAAPAAGAKPAPAAKAAPAVAKPAAERPLPPLEKATDPRDLAEHLRRAGAERLKAAKAEEAAKAPEKKALPKKVAEAKIIPPRPSKDAALTEAESRRGFLAGTAVVAWIIAGWAAFVAGLSAFTVMSLRFMFPNVLAEPPSTIKVGVPANFELGEVNETWKAEWGFWIVRSDVYDGNDVVYALSTICTHLGCPPNWLAGEQKFKCPCHGSGFYVSGVNFEGPAPRPLERYKVSVGDDGQLVVDKSEKYQEELGQWSDPDSFVPMA